MSDEEKELSSQALGAIMMCVQKGILEKSDITEHLNSIKFYEKGGKLFAKNPPKFKVGMDEDGQVDLGSNEEEESDFEMPNS